MTATALYDVTSCLLDDQHQMTISYVGTMYSKNYYIKAKKSYKFVDAKFKESLPKNN